MVTEHTYHSAAQMPPCLSLLATLNQTQAQR